MTSVKNEYGIKTNWGKGKARAGGTNQPRVKGKIVFKDQDKKGQ